MKAQRPDAKVLVGATSALGDHSGRGVGGVPPLRFVRELACVDRRLRPRGTRRRAAASRACPATAGRTTRTRSTSRRARAAPARPRQRADRRARPADARCSAGWPRAGRLARALRTVYVTEYGYETRTRRFAPREQARFLTWAEYLAWRNPRVRTFAQFLLRDVPRAGAGAPRAAARAVGERAAVRRRAPEARGARLPRGPARRALEGGRTRLWGRVRGIAPGAGAVVERRVGRSRWRRFITGTVGRRAVLDRSVPTVGRTRYRMRVRSATGC